MVKSKAAVSSSNRLIIGRILPGVDLIEGIRDLCEKHSIKYGVINSIIGSLRKGGVIYAIDDESSPLGIKYSAPTYFEGPLELLCCQGIVGRDEKGQFQIHLHGLMSDKKLRILGGHFIPDENIVLATAEVSIQAVEDVEFIRKFDEETGFPLFSFIQK